LQSYTPIPAILVHGWLTLVYFFWYVQVNIAHLVPPIVLFLAKHPMVDEYDLSKLEEIFSGAAPLGKDLSELVKQRLPNLKIVRYSLFFLSMGCLSARCVPAAQRYASSRMVK
jgi:acyl-CoA synthetase (AMP-forming)/AMP-acid ligase II